MMLTRLIALVSLITSVAIVAGMSLLMPPASSTKPTIETWGSSASPYGIPNFAPEKIPTAPRNETVTHDVLPQFVFANNTNANLVAEPSNPLDTLRSYISGLGKEAEDNSIPDTSVTNISYTSPLSDQVIILIAASKSPSPITAYGNAAGAIVQILDEGQDSVIVALDTFTAAPTATNAEPLIAFAQRLHETSLKLHDIKDIPSGFVGAHNSLANSYDSIGTALETLANARENSALIAAIFAYNSEVEKMGSAYVRLVQLFSAYSVSFDTNEPGAVFMFNTAQ